MVDVCVRVNEVCRAHTEPLEPRDDDIDVGAAVDDDGFAARAIGDDRTGTRERADANVFDGDVAERYGVVH